MQSLINQYSYIFASLIIFGILAASIIRKSGSEQRKRNFLVLGGVLVGFVTLWFFVRPQAGENSAIREIEAQIGVGTPVLLEFQSQY